MRMVWGLTASIWLALSPAAFAAGGGAGSGGAGAQRTINSGLPPGEPGPPGAPNNRHPATSQPPVADPASPQSQPASPDSTAQ